MLDKKQSQLIVDNLQKKNFVVESHVLTWKSIHESGWKKNILRWFETRTEFFSSKRSATGLMFSWKRIITFLHLVWDRRVYPTRVTHLQIMRQIRFRTLWHSRRQRPLLNTRLQICFVTQLHTLLPTHSLIFCIWCFSPGNRKKIQLV